MINNSEWHEFAPSTFVSLWASVFFILKRGGTKRIWNQLSVMNKRTSNDQYCREIKLRLLSHYIDIKYLLYSKAPDGAVGSASARATNSRSWVRISQRASNSHPISMIGVVNSFMILKYVWSIEIFLLICVAVLYSFKFLTGVIISVLKLNVVSLNNNRKCI